MSFLIFRMDTAFAVKLLVGAQGLSLVGLLASLIMFRREKGKMKQMQRNAMEVIQHVQSRVAELLRLTPQQEVREEQRVPVREEVVVTPDDHVKVRQLLRKAEKFLDELEYGEVEKVLIEALTYNPEDEDVNTMLAYVYRKQQKYSKAESIYIHLIEQGSQDPAVFSNLGRVLEEEGRIEMAVKAYQEALKRDQHNAGRHATLAQIFLKQDDVRQAIDAYEQALRYDTRNIEYMFALVDAYMRVDALMMATKYLDAILYNEPYNEKAKEMLLRIKEQGKISA